MPSLVRADVFTYRHSWFSTAFTDTLNRFVRNINPTMSRHIEYSQLFRLITN